MDGIATSDYAYSYPDVFLSPDNPEPGGIYTLDRAKQSEDPWAPTTFPNRYASDLLMRGDPRGGPRARGGRSEGFSQREYAEGLPMQYPGRSARWDRPALDDVMWDERPRSFRPNSSNQYAQLYVPQRLHDSRYLAYPVYSPSRAVSVIDREPFAGGGAPQAPPCDSVPLCPAKPEGGGRPAARDGNAISAKTLEIGLQMVKVVLWLVIIILLAMWLVAGSLNAKRDGELRRIIEEAVAAAKKT